MTRRRKRGIAYFLALLAPVFVVLTFTSVPFSTTLATIFLCATGVAAVTGICFGLWSVRYSRRVIHSPNELWRGEE